MRDIFNSHPVSVLKKEIAKTNIKGYSKMKKAEVVNLMMKHKDRFTHIKMRSKAEKAPKKKAPKPLKIPKITVTDFDEEQSKKSTQRLRSSLMDRFDASS